MDEPLESQVHFSYIHHICYSPFHTSTVMHYSCTPLTSTDTWTKEKKYLDCMQYIWQISRGTRYLKSRESRNLNTVLLFVAQFISHLFYLLPYSPI